MKASEETDSKIVHDSAAKQKRAWIVTVATVLVSALLCMVLWFLLAQRGSKEVVEENNKTDDGKPADTAPMSVQKVYVVSSAPQTKFSVTGTVEPNQQQLQQITPLVAGRVDQIFVALGDPVQKGTLLVRIDSPQVAEMHGKLHEAETRLNLAKQNLNRVQQAANRVSVIKAKSTLIEAEATLKRIERLVAEGLTARKDLVAAQAEYERAKAEYNFQRDISLNKEVAQARSELKTAQTETEHIQDALRALDAHLPTEHEGTEHNISSIELRSPIAGQVIERLVNPGAGFEQGKPLLTIANTANLWVIANVPENQMALIHVGMPAKISVESKSLNGTVSYIDPRLNEDTRTSRVRIVIENVDHRIQVGAFAQIEFTGSTSRVASAFVPESAVQTINGKPSVFVFQKDGSYKVREISMGVPISGLIPVFSGLSVGEQVAGQGSFVLKSKALKETFGED